MAKKHPYLLSRNGHFYFRYVIPTSLQHLFGCREFVYSLKTTDCQKAKAKVGILLAMAEQVIKTVKEGRLSPEKAREVARQYFKLCLERLEKQFEAVEDHSVERAKAGIFSVPEAIACSSKYLFTGAT
jgi:hypothetical protein